MTAIWSEAAEQAARWRKRASVRRCPSTGRKYLLRVPPHIADCRAAAAWLAGFNNPDEYRPVQET